MHECPGSAASSKTMVSGRRVATTLFLVACIAWQLAGFTAAQQGSTGILTLNGEGQLETQVVMLRAFKVFETRMGVPLRLTYRVTSSFTAVSDIAADAAQQNASSGSALQFAITEQPLNAAARANFTSNPVVKDSIHVPLYVNSYGLFYNVPGNRGTPLNITACLAARILTGDISQWTHPDFLDKNPNFVKAASDSYPITVFIEDNNAGSTLATFSWLSRACPSVPVTYGTLRSDVVKAGSNMVGFLQSTPFSFGLAMGSTGRSASISEFAVETATTGQYLLTGATNTTTLYDKLTTVVPQTLTGDYSGVSVANLGSSRVAPILSLVYLVTKSDWSGAGEAEGQRGEAMKALCTFLLSSTVAGSGSAVGMIADYGLLSLGDSMMTSIRAAMITSFVSRPAAVPYIFTDGNAANVISPTRTAYDVMAYEDVLSQLATLRKTLDISGARVMRGVGSSAVSLFIWRSFSELKARSTSPLHLVYRAAGSGAGQSEMVAKANSYKALVDFGASDTPMSDSSYADLTANAKISVVHIPILLAPMNFFVNFPDGVLPSRQLKMSPCTIAKIMQADITSWAHPDITTDNGYTLPDKPITVFYRQLSSGTTAVITAYLTAACTSWRLGSGSLLTSWPSAFKPTTSSSNMSNSVEATPWSIGYMDAANGHELNLLEVAVKNKAGNFVTSQTGDIPGAATALFKSDAWPKSPTQSFSSVSVLNQPGTSTFPIVAMPFMFVRTDLTSRGDSGTLLLAFLNFMLDSYAQDTIASAVGFSALPAEVRQYAKERAVPLLQVDTRAKSWTFESGSVLPAGKGSADYVISSFAGSYENVNSQAFADFYQAYSLQQNQKNAAAANTTAGNGTSANSTSLADVPANLKDKLDKMESKIAILEAITITAIVFGVVGLTLGIFVSCRMFVHASIWGNQGVSPLLQAGSLTGNSSVRRSKSALSEGSFA